MKNIFENFDAEVYKDLLVAAKNQDVHIVHTFDKFYPWGGFTFAWQRTTDNPRCTMIRVAVSYCSNKDQFCRKIGTFNTLVNFFTGSVVLLPVGDEDSSVIVRSLRMVLDIPH